MMSHESESLLVGGKRSKWQIAEEGPLFCLSTSSQLFHEEAGRGYSIQLLGPLGLPLIIFYVWTTCYVG